jgi:hypothetical protein
VKKKMEPVKTTDPREIVRSGFFTPSRNIRCEFASGKEGPALLVLGGKGSVALLCDTRLLETKDYRQLSYGTVWRRGPIACLSDLAGLRCANKDTASNFVVNAARSSDVSSHEADATGARFALNCRRHAESRGRPQRDADPRTVLGAAPLRQRSSARECEPQDTM